MSANGGPQPIQVARVTQLNVVPLIDVQEAPDARVMIINVAVGPGMVEQYVIMLKKEYAEDLGRRLSAPSVHMPDGPLPPSILR